MAWRPRDRASFAHALLALLPLGEIWSRTAGTVLDSVLSALAVVSARWAERVASFLLIEAYPPSASFLLSDWERVLGLPEVCLPVTNDSVAERQLKVRAKLAGRPGAQSRSYFYQLAQSLNYEITITEYVPAQCGTTPCGAYFASAAPYFVQGAGCGTPTVRFWWTVTVSGPRLTWFAHGAGGGRCGQDPHLRIARAEDLECLLNKFKPAHTKLVFNYTGV